MSVTQYFVPGENGYLSPFDYYKQLPQHKQIVIRDFVCQLMFILQKEPTFYYSTDNSNKKDYFYALSYNRPLKSLKEYTNNFEIYKKSIALFVFSIEQDFIQNLQDNGILYDYKTENKWDIESIDHREQEAIKDHWQEHQHSCVDWMHLFKIGDLNAFYLLHKKISSKNKNTPRTYTLQLNINDELEVKELGISIGKPRFRRAGYYLLEMLFNQEIQINFITLDRLFDYAKENYSDFEKPKSPSFSKILAGLGMKGALADLFFEKTVSTLLFFNPITEDRIQEFMPEGKTMIDLLNKNKK